MAHSHWPWNDEQYAHLFCSMFPMRLDWCMGISVPKTIHFLQYDFLLKYRHIQIVWQYQAYYLATWPCVCPAILDSRAVNISSKVPDPIHRIPLLKRWVISLRDQYDITRIYDAQWLWIVWTEFVQMSNLKVKDAREQMLVPVPGIVYWDSCFSWI